ncbi:MAG: YncE family protein [Candidatus Pseudobacter hemicellulosilyticus]|uniref:YncE family protein n=1 Tax=Candidatus Pseudobacter hemicellulosilyticus TaxID=3121375 RepID=A0AAJ5WP92_9BACT|nr:MAG: YncE family protein [Pseudobacter sp.]
MRKYPLFIIVFLATLAGSCRKDVEVFMMEEIPVAPPALDGFAGFYLLNEGNMGSNKSTLDYYDYATGNYQRNIYAAINPTVPKELGDVGNDIAIYGGKLYAVINASKKVEVMDARTAKRIGQIEIPNCRYIKFDKGFAYITSYAGPIEINPNYAQKGYVAKVDTATLAIVDKCIVGYQPDGLEIVDGKIYVANSGGYMGAGSTEKYERTVSVIDMATFKEEKRIDVDYNLHHIKADQRGNLWVTSRGDYKKLPSRLYFIDKGQQKVTDTVPIAASNYYLDGDSLYIYSTEWSYITYSNVITYAIVNTLTHEVVTRSFITDGTDKEIEIPYGIMVHPITKDIYVTDAGNYVAPGVLYCFDKTGKKKWYVRTGDIPAHFALLPE